MLNALLENSRRRAAEREARRPMKQLMESLEIINAKVGQATRKHSLGEMMQHNAGMAVIAEIKRASPSKGVLAPDLNPALLAQKYHSAGASAISVLTEPTGFRGRDADLTQVLGAVTCPVLRKDFILTPYQVVETAVLGADILLLIAAALTDTELALLHRTASKLNLQCLLEVHNQEELTRVLRLSLDPSRQYIGINNRNLKTFQVSLDTTLTLAPNVPSELFVISESGIKNREQVEQLETVGVRGILVGESLVTVNDPGAVIQTLKGGADHGTQSKSGCQNLWD